MIPYNPASGDRIVSAYLAASHGEAQLLIAQPAGWNVTVPFLRNRVPSTLFRDYLPLSTSYLKSWIKVA